MRVTVDQERCLGAGQCEQLAPEIFTQDEEGVSQVLVTEPELKLRAQVRLVADLCPMQAVLVVEERTEVPGKDAQ